MALIQLSH